MRSILPLVFTLSCITADAATITFERFGSNVVTVDGFTFTSSAVGGKLDVTHVYILQLGGVPGMGRYTFSFSQPIDYLAMKIMAFEDDSTRPRQAIFDFSGDSGAVNIQYNPIFHSAFDGSVIYPTGGAGSGEIIYDAAATIGPDITSFSFTHTAGSQLPFWVSRVVVNTVDQSGTEVPEPGTILLVAGFLGLAVAQKVRNHVNS